MNKEPNLLNIVDASFFEFVGDHNLADKIYQKLCNESFPNKNLSNYTSDSEMSNYWYDKELFDWIYECLASIEKKIHLLDSLKLEVVTSWANKTKKLQAHHAHSHPNSFISGVYYPEDSDEDIIFTMPNIWYQNTPNLTLSSQNYTLPYYGHQQGTPVTGRYKPKKGSLLFFPSHIYHHVSTVKTNETRYSIAFNVYPRGLLGSNTTTQLTLNPVTVRSIYET